MWCGQKYQRGASLWIYRLVQHLRICYCKYLSTFPIWARNLKATHIRWSLALRFSLIALVLQYDLDMALFQEKKALGSSRYSGLVIAPKSTLMDIIFALTPKAVLLVISSLNGLGTVVQRNQMMYMSKKEWKSWKRWVKMVKRATLVETWTGEAVC